MKNVWILFAVGLTLLLSTPSLSAQGWTQQSSGTTEGFNGITFVDDLTGWAAGWDYQNIYHTNDGGQNWTTQAPSNMIYFYDINFCDAQNGTACGTEGSVLYCNDGSTWQTAEWGWMHTNRACYQRTPDNAMVVGSNSVYQPLVTYTTDGWQTIQYAVFYFIQSSTYIEGYLTDVHLVDQNICFATGSAWNGEGAICSSTDGGANWTTDEWATYPLNSITFPTAQVGYAVGDMGTILKTSDGGANWSPLTSGVSTSLRAVDFDSADIGLAVGDGGLVIATIDGGLTWTVENSGIVDTLYGVDCLGQNVAFAAGDMGTIIAKSGGAVPVADIKANGSDTPLTLNYGDNLDIDISLDPGSEAGNNADWWLIVDSPFGWYRYKVANCSWIPGFVVTYQGSLSGFGPLNVYSGTALPVGTYNFHFGVDMDMNGALDMGQMYYDSVSVTVQ